MVQIYADSDGTKSFDTILKGLFRSFQTIFSQ